MATVEIFDALPGLEAPLESLSRSLARMWEQTAADGRPAPPSDDAKATQVNFVLHLGINTDPDDAAAQFQTAVRFSRRYPCRVVVLCPERAVSQLEMRAKVYGECTLGKTKGDTRCCEFVMLSYSLPARRFLESQVSTCLSTDLPLYYWAHRFSDASRLADYRYLLTRSHRILFDSAVVPTSVFSFPWPKPESVRDLAYARLLPVRQSLGQFLSRYPMDAICEDLAGVSVKHGSALAAEGRLTLGWLRDRIRKCGRNQAAFRVEEDPGLPRAGLAVAFDYGGRKSFQWNGDAEAGSAAFTADFGTGKTVLPATISLLNPEAALSEAMFFE